MDIFLSYRRSTGLEIARNIKFSLDKLGYNSFFDLISIREGVFNEQLLKNIKNSDNFVLILSPHALDKCVDSDDWVRREIMEAISLKKHIIPVICDGFVAPDNLPEEIASVVYYQGVKYSGYNFNDMISTLVDYLRDSDNCALKISKKKNITNTFYVNYKMADEEKERIRLDIEVCSSIEQSIFNKLLDGKKECVVFAPAIYEIDSYMRKYRHDSITNVFGFLNHPDDVDQANEKYGHVGKMTNKFYLGNMANSDFINAVDNIMSENQISGFDFVDLTLIIRDVDNPIPKIKALADRVNPGGIIYVRELDHGIACAYPDEYGLFQHALELLKLDKFAGDFEMGRKVYYYLKEAEIDDVHFVNQSVTTEGLNKKEREMLFEALYSYLPREFHVLHSTDSANSDYKDAVEWLEENYSLLKRAFKQDDFFYKSGFMFYYAIID